MAYIDPHGRIVSEEGDTLIDIIREMNTGGAAPSPDVIGSWQQAQVPHVPGGGILPADQPLPVASVLVPPPWAASFFQRKAGEIYPEQSPHSPSYTPGDLNTPPTPTTPTPAPRNPQRTPLTPEQQDAFEIIKGILRDRGLESLTDWAQDQIRRHGTNVELILLNMEQTEAWKQRFKANEERRKLGLDPLSPNEIIEYERSARALLRAAGLPEGFFDQHTDFVEFLAADVSVSELSRRIDEGFTRVTNADPNVRQFFQAYYGVGGDEALAAYFLGPDRAAPLIETQVATAELGAAGAQFGFELARGSATAIVHSGVSQAEARTRFSRLRDTEALFQELVGESEDLRIGVEGIQAAFELDTTSVRKVQNRLEARISRLSGLGGGAIVTADATGLGTAT